MLDLVEAQAGRPPFDPRQAVTKFCALLEAYGCVSVWGDDYAGQTFKVDFAAARIVYRSPVPSASDLYERFEPQLNAGEAQLLDHAKAQEQFCTLVMRERRSVTRRANMTILPARSPAAHGWFVSRRLRTG